MSIKKILLSILAIAASLSFSAAPAEAKDITHNKPKTFLRSHSKQIGTIGRYEVHQIKVRGLDTPNVAAAVIYDPATEQLLVVGPGVAPGLGTAIVSAAGNAGAAALFGQSLRPTRQTISNGNSSTGSSAGTAVNNSNNLSPDQRNTSNQLIDNHPNILQTQEQTSPGGQFVPPGHVDNPSQNK